ncbi:hypothetical protein PQX77_014550 [Marasmius sp. AFHP31]|nr:hypothetical protein PQX77_014550 [Marasmius sp. AFHP31]
MLNIRPGFSVSRRVQDNDQAVVYFVSVPHPSWAEGLSCPSDIPTPYSTIPRDESNYLHFGSPVCSQKLKTTGSLAEWSEDSSIERDERVESTLLGAGMFEPSSLNKLALSLSSSTSNTAPGIVETKTLSLPIRLEDTTIVASGYLLLITETPETYSTAFGSTILAPCCSAVTHPTIYSSAVVLAHPSAIGAHIPAFTTSVLPTGYGFATHTSDLEA